MTRTIAILIALSTISCDSLVTDPCETGYERSGGRCVQPAGSNGGGSGDGMIVVDVLGGPPTTCTLPEIDCGGVCIDVTSDPDNCGACGNSCASGFCVNGACTGSSAGHVVAIGHDYTNYHLGAARVLGNAIALGASKVVRVGFWRGAAGELSADHTVAAAIKALDALARPNTLATIPEVTAESLASLDVVVIDAQLGDGAAAEATGHSWAPALDVFLLHGGVVVILEGDSGVSYRLARAAGLYDVPAPITVTGGRASVAAPADAVAYDVPSPYAAETSTVSFAGVPPVIEADDGSAIAFHLTY